VYKVLRCLSQYVSNLIIKGGYILVNLGSIMVYLCIVHLTVS